LKTCLLESVTEDNTNGISLGLSYNVIFYEISLGCLARSFSHYIKHMLYKDICNGYITFKKGSIYFIYLLFVAISQGKHIT